MLLLFAVLWMFQPANELLWNLALSVTEQLHVPMYMVRMGFMQFRGQSQVLILLFIGAMFLFRRKK